MHSPIPKSLTALLFAGTAYQRSPEKAVVYTLDALAVYGLLSIVRSPFRWTNILRVGGVVVWGAARFSGAVDLMETFVRAYRNPSETKVLEKKPDFQDDNTEEWDKNLGGWPLMLDLVDDLPEPTEGVTLEQLLKRDMVDLCRAGFAQESQDWKQFWVDVRHCLSQEVTIGDEELMVWKDQNGEVYCLLNRSEVLKEALSADWAVGSIYCHRDLFDEEQSAHIGQERSNEGLLALKRADQPTEEELMAQMMQVMEGGDPSDMKAFALGQMDLLWIHICQAVAQKLNELPKPSDKIDLCELLSRDQGERLAFASNPDLLISPEQRNQALQELLQFFADLKHALGEEQEKVTIGDDVTDWAVDNGDVYCLINRPEVLVEVLCSELATCKKIQVELGLFSGAQLQLLNKADNIELT